MNETLQKTLGRNLKLMRQYYQISQDKLSDMVGITRSQYAQYELGNRTPDLEVLHMICSHFGQSLDSMFESNKEQFLCCVCSNDDVSNHCSELVSYFKQLSVFSQGRVLEFASKLLEEDNIRAANQALLSKKRSGQL